MSIDTVLPEHFSQEHQESKARLERLLSERPNRDELVQRNILQESNLAPTLQETAKALKFHKLQDSLDRQIRARPTAQELVEHNILHTANPNIAPEIQRAQIEFERAQKMDKLKHYLEDRSSPEDLVARGILTEQDLKYMSCK